MKTTVEDWMNLRDEIYVEFHDVIYNVLFMPNGLVVLLEQYFHMTKEHLKIIDWVKEMFDYDTIHIEINIIHIEEDIQVLRLLIEEVI